MIDEVDEVEEILSRMCPVVAQPSLSATTDQSSSFSASFDQPYLSASAGQPVSTSQLAQSPHLGVDPNITAEKEEATVLAYMTNTCGCQRHNNGPCSQQFTVDYILQARMDAAELSKSELDMVILGQIMAFINTHDTVSATAISKQKAVPRLKPYSTYCHQGVHICASMFRCLHGVGKLAI